MFRILLCLFVFSPMVSLAQESRTFDTSFANNASNDFFLRNPDVDSIQSYRAPNPLKSIVVFLKPFGQDNTKKETVSKKVEYFNLEYLGDKYRFERKYGELKLPEDQSGRAMALVRSQACNISCFIQMVVKPDSLKYLVTCYCPHKDDEDYDKIFTKVERGPKFKNGDYGLQKHIEVALKEKYSTAPIPLIDSVLIFKVLVDNKDSCLKSVELIDGKDSPFAQVVMNELKSACGWIAGHQGGRPVMAYYEVFVRLNNDKSITVSTPNW